MRIFFTTVILAGLFVISTPCAAADIVEFRYNISSSLGNHSGKISFDRDQAPYSVITAPGSGTTWSYYNFLVSEQTGFIVPVADFYTVFDPSFQEVAVRFLMRDLSTREQIDLSFNYPKSGNPARLPALADLTTPLSSSFQVAVGRTSATGTATISPTALTAVPEARTWAMMLIGFGGIGGMMRRRRQSATVKFA